jgi:uncharacterized protein DUF4382
MRGIDGKQLGTSALLISALALGGCGGMVEGQPGMVHVGLVSAGGTVQSASVQAASKSSGRKLVSAIVTITQIDAHLKGGNWTPIMTTPISVDLLQLDKKSTTALGIGALPQPRVDQLRLVIDPKSAFVVDDKGNKTALEIPDSGTVKVVGVLDFDGCSTGGVILDFDPRITTDKDDECGSHNGCNDKSTHYVLRCRATLKTEEVHGMCCDPDPTPVPGPGQCGNGNVTCSPDQICKNGDCIDACFGVTCGTGTSCIKGQCVSNDPCD